jgi:hypothetical protein
VNAGRPLYCGDSRYPYCDPNIAKDDATQRDLAHVRGKHASDKKYPQVYNGYYTCLADAPNPDTASQYHWLGDSFFLNGDNSIDGYFINYPLAVSQLTIPSTGEPDQFVMFDDQICTDD